MDDLTRERFWPRPTAAILEDEIELIIQRRRILLGETALTTKQLRARARAMKRDRQLATAIRGAMTSHPGRTT
jgi:hypothetical protein